MSSVRQCSALLPVCLAFVFGCTERSAIAPTTPSAATTIANPIEAAAQARSDSLARGLAIALTDADIRLRLRNDLRDSPFLLHALPLGTYLSGAEGMSLAAKAGAALGIGSDAFIRLAESGKALELVMPRVLDRVSWTGGEDIDVTATQINFADRVIGRRMSEAGFDSRGSPTVVNTFRYSARPYLIARPATQEFPADPEQVRSEAPKHTWNTVSTPEEERSLMSERGRRRVQREGRGGSNLVAPTVPSFIIACGDPGAPPDCDPPPPPPPPPPSVGGGGATLPSYMTKSYCYAVTPATDFDNDQIRDDCEAELALRLAPQLNIGNDDWVPARQPYWAAARHVFRPDNVQIIYALSYLRDGGFAFDFYHDAHEGDSEFIILEVINSTGSTWGIIEATLSAHFDAEQDTCYYATGNQYCGLDSYYWDDLDYPLGPFPRIWSSLGKHANYRNRAACESGADLQDSCSGDFVGVQILAASSRNLGNYYHVPVATRTSATWRQNCTLWTGSTYVYGYFRTAQECFWTDDRFSGWDPLRPDAVTPYKRIFEIFGF
jgi:hypothetical protein